MPGSGVVAGPIRALIGSGRTQQRARFRPHPKHKTSYVTPGMVSFGDPFSVCCLSSRPRFIPLPLARFPFLLRLCFSRG